MWAGQNLSEIPQLLVMEPTPTSSLCCVPSSHICVGHVVIPWGGLGECARGS